MAYSPKWDPHNICCICNKHVGAGFDHTQCSKIKKARLQKPIEKARKRVSTPRVKASTLDYFSNTGRP